MELILLALHLCWFDAIEKLEKQGPIAGNIGTWRALLHGWILCVGVVCLANVPDLVHWRMLNEWPNVICFRLVSL